MAAFPTLRSGAVMQYPAQRQTRCSTSTLRFMDGREQRFRAIRGPRCTWTVRVDLLTDEELDELQRFFIAMSGSHGRFSFTDPWNGVTYPDCSFDQEAFEAEWTAPGRSKATVIIREN
jgi:hypothetical protein